MSDRGRIRPEAERTARVWLPSDFLLAVGPGERFQARRWRNEAARRFLPQPDPQSMTLARAPEPPPPAPAPAAKAPAPSAPPPEPASPGVTQEALEEARLEAYAKGQEHGREEARRQFQQERAAADAVLGERLAGIEAALDELRHTPERLHEPLKRLALHLAEQLVLGELSQSAQAIERLVRRCVDELTASRPIPVRVSLNPGDLTQLQAWLAGLPEGEVPAWQLQADERLAPGSVRAGADDAVVADLIENRLDALARQLRLDAPRARQDSAFQPERLAARRAEVDAVLDAQPRMADPVRSARFAPVVEAQASEALADAEATEVMAPDLLASDPDTGAVPAPEAADPTVAPDPEAGA